MNVEIKVTNDELFTLGSNLPEIQCHQFGEALFIASDGVTTFQGLTREDAIEGLRGVLAEKAATLTQEEVTMETPQPPPNNPYAAPLENPRSNNFDLFAGTSWEGKKNSFN